MYVNVGKTNNDFEILEPTKLLVNFNKINTYFKKNFRV